MNRATSITLSAEQRRELLQRAEPQAVDRRKSRRARIVLMAADGVGNREIARSLGISRNQVILWRNRFSCGGLAAIEGNHVHSGRKTRIDPIEIMRLTMLPHPEGAKRWSTRSLAARMGISDTTVHRVWRAYGLQPHLEKPKEPH